MHLFRLFLFLKDIEDEKKRKIYFPSDSKKPQTEQIFQLLHCED